MGAASAIKVGDALHCTRWKAQIRWTAHCADAHSHLSHSGPSVCSRGTARVSRYLCRCAGMCLLSNSVCSHFQVYFCAWPFKQENAVIIKVIIKKWSLWSKQLSYPRDVYKVMKFWLTQATKSTNLPLSRAAVASTLWAHCTHLQVCVTPNKLFDTPPFRNTPLPRANYMLIFLWVMPVTNYLLRRDWALLCNTLFINPWPYGTSS